MLRTLALLVAAALGLPAGANPGVGSNVPDVVTRRSGLRLAPLARPAQTYALNCQGCHGEYGTSAPEIPALAGRVGYFARSDAGRRYLVQVPNVALNPGSDADIAAVLNWLLLTYSRRQLPPDFRPYSAAEVGELRRARIDVAATRAGVVAELAAVGALPAPDALALAGPSSY